MTPHPIVSPQEWTAERAKLLAEEKEFTRLRDQLSARRRALPWERVESPYEFDGPSGKTSLAALFGDKSQLVVYHFMFEPEADEGCKHCSFWADNFERNVIHLAHRDVTLVAISRAPLQKLQAYARRLKWTFTWVSSLNNTFNRDYQVSYTPEDIASGNAMYNGEPAKWPGERPGISVFFKDEDGSIYRTYSCYARGLDMMNTAYQYLDLVPKGRDEEGQEFSMAWVRRNDSY